MDKDQRVAFLMAQTACMYAELEAMKAANHERTSHGLALEWGEGAFLELPAKYGLTHNQAIEFLRAY